MPLPSQGSIELPLLLELERHSGRVKPGGPSHPQFYDSVARHFPDMTTADRALKRKDGRTLVWDNAVAWARNRLRRNAQLGGAERGVWTITEAGRQHLREELRKLGLPRSDVEAFIASSGTLKSVLGSQWTPPRWQPRTRVRGTEGGTELVTRPAPPRGQAPPQPLPQIRAPQEVAQRLLSRISALEPEEFERLVGELFRALGMEVTVTGRSHDGGIDGIVGIPLLGVKVAVQAKKWANQMVGVDLVQRLMGSVQSGRCDRGVFVTTAGFTAGAQELAQDPANRVALIDGEALVRLLVDKGVGIKEQPVVTQELDEDFFQSLGRP